MSNKYLIDSFGYGDPEMDRTAMAPATMMNLYRIMCEQTDENHGLSANRLIDALTASGTPLGRTTLLAYLSVLDDYLYKNADDRIFEDSFEGCIIKPGKGSNKGYRLAIRQFTILEIQLLIEAVMASDFIDKKTADKLIEKLLKLVSKPQASEIRNQINNNKIQ